MNDQNASTSRTSSGTAASDSTSVPGPRKESARLAVGPNTSSNPEPVNPFIEKNALPLLIGAVGGGLIAGLLLRQGEVGAELTPGQQVRNGSRALFLGAAAAAAAAFSRWSKAAKKELQPHKLRKQGEQILRKAQRGVEAAVAQVH